MSENVGLDKEIKDLAVDWAEKVYNSIYRALNDPTQGMPPDIVRIYGDLRSWGWFDIINIDDEKAHEILLKILAMSRYKQLLQNKINPPLSKWERVVGKSFKKK